MTILRASLAVTHQCIKATTYTSVAWKPFVPVPNTLLHHRFSYHPRFSAVLTRGYSTKTPTNDSDLPHLATNPHTNTQHFTQHTPSTTTKTPADSSTLQDPPPTNPPVVASPIPTERITDLKGLIAAYLSLSKFRLSSLVVVTTMAGFVMAPAPFNFPLFIYSSVGTTLAIASANTLNQIYEVSHDAKMSRTLKRILPTGKISIPHALAFGTTTGLVGTAILYYGVNPFAAALAFSNILLYAGIYTPLKRVHPINTWVGSIVGAIPPMIGWVSVTNSLDPGAWILGYLLFVWQIPHFLALSWGLRRDYSKAGYKMLSTENPDMLPRLCLRYCIYLLPVGVLSWWYGLTDGYFAIDSTLVNAYLIWYGYQFYKDDSLLKARKLFFSTLLYLPVLLVLMILHATRWHITSEDAAGESKIVELESNKS